MKLAGYQVSRGNWYIEMSPCMLLSYIIRLSQLHTSAKPCHFSFSNTHQLIIWSKYLLQVTVVVSVVLLSKLWKKKRRLSIGETFRSVHYSLLGWIPNTNQDNPELEAEIGAKDVTTDLANFHLRRRYLMNTKFTRSFLHWESNRKSEALYRWILFLRLRAPLQWRDFPERVRIRNPICTKIGPITSNSPNLSHWRLTYIQHFFKLWHSGWPPLTSLRRRILNISSAARTLAYYLLNTSNIWKI